MLLASRERQHPAAAAVAVDGLADQPAGHLADVFLAGREQPDIGAAEGQRIADRLALGGDDVGAHLAGRLHRAERHRLGDGDDQQGALRPAGLGQRAMIAQMAEEAGVLHHHAAGLAIDQWRQVLAAGRVGRGGHHGKAVEAGVGLDDLAIMRMQRARQHGAAAPGNAVGHHHRLGGRGGAVIHRRIGHIHAGDQRHLGLELEEILQRPLGDLGLVGRVGGEELAALDEVVDRRRHVMAIGAGAEEARRPAGAEIPGGECPDAALDLDLAEMVRQVDRGGQPRARRDVAEQAVDRGHADGRQHGAAVGIGQRQIAHQCSPAT